MHTHLDHSLLCLISSLLSLSSSLSMPDASASMLSCSRRDILITTLLLPLPRSRMELAGAGGGGPQGQGPGQQQGESLILTLRKTTVPHSRQKRLKRRAVHNLSAPHPVPQIQTLSCKKFSRTKSLSLRNKTLPSPLSSYL